MKNVEETLKTFVKAEIANADMRLDLLRKFIDTLSELLLTTSLKFQQRLFMNLFEMYSEEISELVKKRERLYECLWQIESVEVCFTYESMKSAHIN